MTKAELVAKMAEKAGVTKKDAEACLNGFVDAVTEALKSGDKITMVGFGTFSTAKRAARKGQNPQTGKKIDIPAATTAKFKVGATLKIAVNAPAAAAGGAKKKK